MSKRDIAFQDAVDTVLNTRDMCGDEVKAIKQVEDDHGIEFTRGERFNIWLKANDEWNKSQADAGVPAHKRGDGRPYDKPNQLDRED